MANHHDAGSFDDQFPSTRKDTGDPSILDGSSHTEEAATPLDAPLHRKLKSRHLQMIAIGGTDCHTPKLAELPYFFSNRAF